MVCNNCGSNILERDFYCYKCGAPVSVNSTQPYVDKDKEFMDTTYRLMTWERKACSITSKVFLITGIIFFCLFFSLAFLYLFLDELAVFSIVFFIYAIVFGGMFIGVGIVNKVLTNKLTFYIDNFSTQPQLAFTRCRSIGILVINYLFNSVSLVFYIINFVRIRSSKQTIERIISR